MTEPCEGGGFSYQTNGNGRWWRTQRAWRCLHVGLFFKESQCQGVLNHEGPHWCYDERGWFCTFDGEYHANTPPDHQQYRGPEEMAEFAHWTHRPEPFEITDPDEIARLDAGDLEAGESSIGPFR